MRKTKLLVFLLMLFLLTTVVVACDNDTPTENPPVVETGNIVLDKTSATMDLYETLTLTATLDSLSGDVVWSSSDETKATVVNGIVTSAFQKKSLMERVPAEIELEDGTHKAVKFIRLTDAGRAFDPDAEVESK